MGQNLVFFQNFITPIINTQRLEATAKMDREQGQLVLLNLLAQQDLREFGYWEWEGKKPLVPDGKELCGIVMVARSLIDTIIQKDSDKYDATYTAEVLYEQLQEGTNGVPFTTMQKQLYDVDRLIRKIPIANKGFNRVLKNEILLLAGDRPNILVQKGQEGKADAWYLSLLYHSLIASI